jgi:hypothetical protein
MTWPITILGTATDEEHAIDRVSEWFSILRHRKPHTREQLEIELRDGLREGGLTLVIKAVEAAYKGDEIADAALRHVGGELQTWLMQKRDLAPGHPQVITYFQGAGQRAPHKRPRGHRWHDDWLRNMDICICIYLACIEFGVNPTRNRASRRAKQRPSGISLVVAALECNKVHIDEASITRHLWQGLTGELVRGFLSRGLLNLRNALAYDK